jgi:hypothetical protein
MAPRCRNVYEFYTSEFILLSKLVDVLIIRICTVWITYKLKGLVKDSFEFRNTKNGTRVVPKAMEYLFTIKSFDKTTFHYFT